MAPHGPVHLKHEISLCGDWGMQVWRKEQEERTADAKALGWVLEDRQEDSRGRMMLKGRMVGKDVLNVVGVSVLVGHEKDFSF